ncbi:MAG: hypothetical protein HS100_16080 [Anaerolineales bacterium]|nr:hypothetical protein [Anaerolineales bacterium]
MNAPPSRLALLRGLPAGAASADGISAGNSLNTLTILVILQASSLRL